MAGRVPGTPINAMAADIIDHRLIGALHVRALRRSGLAHDRAAEHTAFQAGTLDALMGGRYDGDITIGELLDHGNHGIGTLQHLDGEVVVLDGECWVIDFNGAVRRVAPETRTPFAVLCQFAPTASTRLSGPLSLVALHAALDALAAVRKPGEPESRERDSVEALRVDGEFTNLRLRSVKAQTPPYPPLSEVTKHQTEWTLPRVTGTLIGFRFPDSTAGLEVPGYHLHFLADDRRHGGHVLEVTLVWGDAAVEGVGELHVELPPGLGLGVPGAGDRDAIRGVEGA
jgi:acetolactate decarboxylase